MRSQRSTHRSTASSVTMPTWEESPAATTYVTDMGYQGVQNIPRHPMTGAYAPHQVPVIQQNMGYRYQYPNQTQIPQRLQQPHICKYEPDLPTPVAGVDACLGTQHPPQHPPQGAWFPGAEYPVYETAYHSQGGIVSDQSGPAYFYATPTQTTGHLCTPR